MTLEDKIDAFFNAYEQRFTDGLSGKADIEATTAAFASSFVEASPAGVHCAQNDKTFREAIPKGYEFYKKIGTQSMKVGSKEITRLDEFHLLCKIHWKSSYLTADKKTVVIDFDVFYFLQHLNNELKIFGYVTGDEQKVLKEKGLI